MTFQLHGSIKLMEKIQLNENTTGDIPSKHCHLMALMLKMNSNNIITIIAIIIISSSISSISFCCYGHVHKYQTRF